MQKRCVYIKILITSFYIQDLRGFLACLSRSRPGRLSASWWRTRAASATGPSWRTGGAVFCSIFPSHFVSAARKGILGNVSLGGEVLTGWRMTGLPLDDGEELETGAARVREDTRTNKQYKQFLRLAKQRRN